MTIPVWIVLGGHDGRGGHGRFPPILPSSGPAHTGFAVDPLSAIMHHEKSIRCGKYTA